VLQWRSDVTDETLLFTEELMTRTFDDPDMQDDFRGAIDYLKQQRSLNPLPKLQVPPPLPVGSAKLYTMKVTLLDVSPPIWRRFVAPSFMKLGHLHELLQVFMGWDDTHAYAFTINGKRFASHDRLTVDAILDKRGSYDANNYELCQLIKPGMTFNYEYDFENTWDHEIVVENSAASTDTKYCFYCIEGERACPPENCGGPEAYEQLLQVLSDPDHPEFDRRRARVGWDFDSEKFDPKDCNLKLNVRNPTQLASAKVNQAALNKKKKQERKRKEAAKKRNRS